MVAVRVVSVAFALATAVACSTAPPPTQPQARGLAGRSYVDLTHDLSAAAIFWPTAEEFHLDVVSDGLTDKGYYYAANNFAGAEHGGTHIDAPVHFAKDHWTVDQIPLDRLIGDALVIDVSAKAAADPDYRVTVADFEEWERSNGAIEPGSIVLIRTDFSKRWPDAAAYLGTAERGDAAVAKLHFPGLHPDAATWLAESREVKSVGLDTASIDYGQSTLFETHRALYERNIPAFENLTNLDRLPARGASLVALPSKIKGGSGAPLRAVAIL
ncbi:MAG: cyclase family protein [Vicinamibacterales bacterium]